MKLFRLERIAVVVFGLVILAGCGGGNSSSTSASTSAPSATTSNGSIGTVVAVLTSVM